MELKLQLLTLLTQILVSHKFAKKKKAKSYRPDFLEIHPVRKCAAKNILSQMISRKQLEHDSAFLKMKINFLTAAMLCVGQTVLLFLSESFRDLNLITTTNKDVLFRRSQFQFIMSFPPR